MVPAAARSARIGNRHCGIRRKNDANGASRSGCASISVVVLMLPCMVGSFAFGPWRCVLGRGRPGCPPWPPSRSYVQRIDRTGRLGLVPPVRTLPLSLVLAGAGRTGRLTAPPPTVTLPLSVVPAGFGRAGGRLTAPPPSATLPLSLVLAGAGRTGPKLGLAPPVRTLPLSVVPAGFGRTGPRLTPPPPSTTLPESPVFAGRTGPKLG